MNLFKLPKKKLTKRGFTMIELMVAVSIAAVIAAVGITSFGSVSSKTRDARRKNDLRQLGSALQIYYQKNNAYVTGNGDCSDSTNFYNTIAPYMTQNRVPTDPQTHTNYCYQSINNGTSYRLYATLENCSDSDVIDKNNCSTSNLNFTTSSPDLTAIAYAAATPTPIPTPHPIPTPPTPTVTCSSSPNPGIVGQSVTWTATPIGGVGGYSYYTWGGAASGNTQTVGATYSSAGSQVANVTVTDSNGRTSAQATCSINVNTSVWTNVASYWNLDGNLADSAGTNTGTNNFASFTTGKIGQSDSFNGSSYATMGTSSTLDHQNSLTLSTWIKTAQSLAPGNYASLAGKGFLTGPINGYGLYLDGDNSNKVSFQVRQSAGNSAVGIHSSNSLNDNNWHHVVGVIDDSTHTILLYVDGVSNSSTSFAGIADGTSTANFSLGARDAPGSFAYFFNGQVDEVGVWNRALTSTEVNKLYNCGSGLAYGATPLSVCPVVASCSVSPSAVATNQNATWTASVSGGTGSGYTYAWSGTDGLSGTTSSVIKSYSNNGTKTGAVTVIDGGGNSSGSVACTNSLTVSPPPGNFLVNTIAGGDYSCSGTTPYINISWGASTNATSYNIYRNSTLLTSTSNTNYTDNTVNSGTSYSYYVIAVNAYGQTQSSNSTNSVTAPQCAIAPVFDSASSAHSTTSVISWNHTVGSNTNRILVVGVSYSGWGSGTIGADYGGVSLTRYAGGGAYAYTNCAGSAPVTSEIWYLLNPNPGTNLLKVTFNASFNISAGAISWSNINQTVPFGATFSAADSGSSDSYNCYPPATTTYNSISYNQNQAIFDNLAWSDPYYNITSTATPGSGVASRYNSIQATLSGSGGTVTGSGGSGAISWTIPCIDSYGCGWIDTAVVLNSAQFVGQTYTDNFTSGVTPTSQCTNWNTFKNTLTGSYSLITIRGSVDPTGVNCSGANANTLCQALRTGAYTGYLYCNNRYWNAGSCGNGSEVDASPGGIFVCACNNGPYYTVRPCIGNPAWGAVNGYTCGAPSQSMTVVCQ